MFLSNNGSICRTKGKNVQNVILYMWNYAILFYRVVSAHFSMLFISESHPPQVQRPFSYPKIGNTPLPNQVT